jgi:hypothetical protein
VERTLASPEGLLVAPDRLPARCAALVLAGSSGRVETGRVRLLAGSGEAAMSIRWFGGPGQPRGICEVPLEDHLRFPAGGSHRLGQRHRTVVDPNLRQDLAGRVLPHNH